MSRFFSHNTDADDNMSLFVKQDRPPPMLICHSHCDLDLYPIEPKIDREHLLSVTNVCMKFEKAGPNQTLVIYPTRLYTMDGQTNGLTDRQVQGNIPPLHPQQGVSTREGKNVV